jgi:hypothetical protein
MATTARMFANRESCDPVLPHEDHTQFTALLERYQSEFAPATAHEDFLVSQMAGARWKLDRAERIETAMFAALESPGDRATTEALMAQFFLDKDTSSGRARLDRYRANLERTYRRCALELRAIRKIQNEANSQQLAEKKFEKLLKKMLDSAPPGYEFQPKLVPIDQTGKPTTTPSSPTP